MTETLQVVDPHVHLWDLSTGIYPHLETPNPFGDNAAICRSYLLDEFLGEGDGAVEVLGAVHVEAFPTDPLIEVETLSLLAERSPIPIVTVAHGDLTSAALPRLLDAYGRFSSVRGIRQIVNQHPDPRFGYGIADRMAHPKFLEGLRMLGDRGLSFDLQLYPHQFDEAAGLIEQAPKTHFVLNHAGMWVDRDQAGWQAWKAGIGRLAKFDNVAAKISGFGLLDHDWTLANIRPLVLGVIDAFGTERAMFASNFPVDKLQSTYIRLWQAYASIVRNFSSAEKAALFRNSACTVYRIDLPANTPSALPHDSEQHESD